MKRNLIYCLSVIISFVMMWSCSNNDVSEKNINKDTTILLTTDTSKKENVLHDSLQPEANEVENTVNSNDTPVDVTPNLRLGKHNFTLQWISWDHPGTVTIEPPSEDGWYAVIGRQERRAGYDPNSKDYIIIQGHLKPITDKKLMFRGFVEHQMETLNGGKPCRKEGEQIFLSTKGRKYWRMQDMQNCEGGMITDYIDIYF